MAECLGPDPHGQGLKEPIEDDGLPREVVLARKCIDQMGLDYQIVFPNALLFLGMHPVPEMEVHLATAYNRWLVERVLPEDPRIRAMLYLPFNNPEAAEETVKRFLGKPGVAGFLVTSSRHKPVHANEYMRLYAMLEEAGQGSRLPHPSELAGRVHLSAQPIHFHARHILRAV